MCFWKTQLKVLLSSNYKTAISNKSKLLRNLLNMFIYLVLDYRGLRKMHYVGRNNGVWTVTTCILEYQNTYDTE